MEFLSKIVSHVFPGRVPERPDLPWVVVVSHEASRTGAPIVAYNLAAGLSDRFNVIVMSLKRGPLIDAFRDVSTMVYAPRRSLPRSIRFELSINAFIRGRDVRFAILNSVETFLTTGPSLAQRTKTVGLIHEFAAYLVDHDKLRAFFALSDAVVFSASVTLEDSRRRIGFPDTTRFVVLPQGKCVVPGKTQAEDDTDAKALAAVLRPNETPREFLVLGAGTSDYRKGTDLFVLLAALTRAAAPEIRFRFVWIGGSLTGKVPGEYALFLADQIERLGVSDIISVLPPTAEIETAYRLADVLLLSSRLDPLPNVAIDAMSAGLPVLSFDTATGVAELMHAEGLGEACVAPYLDLAAMAERLVALARSPALCREVGERSARLARERLDMKRYVNALVDLAEGLGT